MGKEPEITIKAGSRLTPTRIEAIREWRKSLHLRIREHNAAVKAVRTALNSKDPKADLMAMMPFDEKGVESISDDETKMRCTIARKIIINELRENPEWKTNVFAETLGLSMERMRQLRHKRPITLKSMGISSQRECELVEPEWKPRGTVRKTQKKWRGTREKGLSQREKIMLLAMASSYEVKELGINAYVINMMLGNSDLPSHNVEWKIIEMASNGYFECSKWLDGRRKVYVLTDKGEAFIKAQGVTTKGALDFVKWLESIPRQKRNTGTQENAPAVEVINEDGTVSTPREWIGIKGQPSKIGGQELDASWSGSNENENFLIKWKDEESCEKGSYYPEAIEEGEIIEEPDEEMLPHAIHALRISFYKDVRRASGEASIPLNRLGKMFLSKMLENTQKYAKTRPLSIINKGFIPNEQEAKVLEEILGIEDDLILKYPRYAPWAISKMKNRK